MKAFEWERPEVKTSVATAVKPIVELDESEDLAKRDKELGTQFGLLTAAEQEGLEGDFIRAQQGHLQLLGVKGALDATVAHFQRMDWKLPTSLLPEGYQIKPLPNPLNP